MVLAYVNLPIQTAILAVRQAPLSVMPNQEVPLKNYLAAIEAFKVSFGLMQCAKSFQVVNQMFVEASAPLSSKMLIQMFLFFCGASKTTRSSNVSCWWKPKLKRKVGVKREATERIGD